MDSNPSTVHAFSNDALADHDAVALATLLKKGDLRPRDVIEAAIARARKVNPQLNAIVADRFEQALADTAGKPGRGFFAGVPTFIKGNTPVAGFPTTHGTATINPKPESENGPYARQYLDQGFSLLGISTLPEFGFNATTEPAHTDPTRNPWNTAHSCGASSGGAAALVAAGVVPIAHANDGGGSIRIPAACCGLVGLKPSRGRHVWSDQAKSLPVKIIGEGVVTRSVRDTAYFHAEAEKYFRNPKLPPIGLVTGPGKERLRIGVAVDSITGYATDGPTRATVERTAALLQEMGHQVEEAPLPFQQSFIGDFVMYWGFLSFMTEKFGRKVVDPSFDPSRLDGLSQGLSAHFKKRFLKTPVFLYRLQRTYRQYASAFDKFDLMLTPVLAHTTPPLGHLSPTVPFEELLNRLIRYVSFTPMANTSGAPAISLPMGTADGNLPIGIQLSANHGMEKRLLEVAYELEQANPWRKIQS